MIVGGEPRGDNAGRYSYPASVYSVLVDCYVILLRTKIGDRTPQSGSIRSILGS